VGRVLLDAVSKALVDTGIFTLRFAAWCFRWSVAALVFLALMAGAAYYVFNQAVEGGGYVIVPDVTGMPVTKASTILGQAGLELGVQRQVVSDRIPEYHVLLQRPTANRSVRMGRKVNLTISAGRESESVPGVVGKTLEAALKELETTRFAAGSIARIHRDAPENLVLGQDPAAGADAAVGSEIHLLISDGPEQKQTFMPDLVGKSIEETQILLAGMDVQAVPFSVDREGTNYETVLAQSPPPGTLLSPGQQVTFDVRLLPTTFLPNARRKISLTYTVPDVSEEVQVRVEVADQAGRKEPLYPLPADFVNGLPPRHPPGTQITFQIAFLNEATVEFYANGELHQSYYFEGSAEPVVTDHDMHGDEDSGRFRPFRRLRERF
jgi:beta-lactam-binding protein with PASTA domain